MRAPGGSSSMGKSSGGDTAADPAAPALPLGNVGHKIAASTASARTPRDASTVSTKAQRALTARQGLSLMCSRRAAAPSAHAATALRASKPPRQIEARTMISNDSTATGDAHVGAAPQAERRCALRTFRIGTCIALATQGATAGAEALMDAAPSPLVARCKGIACGARTRLRARASRRRHWRA